ncbi:MAG: Bax inhibitor-1 family protein [Burkholderiales bacterium]|jgi:modulator of FtsH protease|nr:Bax inhibitor-1 family protein [Burkholderiales bacterium]
MSAPLPLRDAAARGVRVDDSARKVLRQTWWLLALTMVPTVVGALVGIQTAAWMVQHPILLTLGMLGGAIGLQFAIAAHRNSGIGVALLLLLTLLLGWFLGPLLNVALSIRNGGQLIGYAAAGTGIVLAAMSTIATTSKRDFSGLGRFLVVGMIVLVVASLANMWLQLPVLSLVLSTMAIGVFSLFLLHDVNRIVRGGETNYIMAATGVYMSLFNIFANLLNLLLALGGERD